MIKNAFLMLRLNDHIQYMKKIQRSLNNKGDFNGTDYHDCKLGEWLYGEAEDEIKSIGNQELEKVFKELFEPHENYHNASQKALKYHQQNDQNEAKEYETDMIIISNVLVNLLLKMDSLLKKNR